LLISQKQEKIFFENVWQYKPEERLKFVELLRILLFMKGKVDTDDEVQSIPFIATEKVEKRDLGGSKGT